MEFLIDTADIESIKQLVPSYPISGVTSNPTIIKKVGRVEFFEHMRQIQQLIENRSLHVQVIAADAPTMVDQAHQLIDALGDQIYIKVPVTHDGLSAITTLKAENARVTATAIYSEIQGQLAIAAGADYIATYVNRMEGLNIDPYAVITSLAGVIARDQLPTKILGASYKNAGQVVGSINAGAHAVTVDPGVLRGALQTPIIVGAVSDFASDWRDTFGTDAISG